MKQSKKEKEINAVLKYHDEELSKIKRPNTENLDTIITNSENILESLGYDTKNICQIPKTKKTVLKITSWNELYNEAKNAVGNDVDIKDLFTAEELKDNSKAVKILNEEYKQLYQLDTSDLYISIFAGIISSVVDILLVGIPHKTGDGIKAGRLSDYVRQWFEQKFPEADMEELANSKISKVSFDAQDNRHTKEYVNGLSAYYHRLLSIGHDPFLGLIFGVFDILNGTMTTIDKKGKIVSQVMENYSDRKETDIFSAISKQIIHFKSDITTSMGLPAPLMSLFNLLQFGNIGEEEQTIAEIVQGMYFEGYDFIQFCSSSIPTMINEVIVRLFYALKKIKQGYKVKDSIPFSSNREKNPKLATMLFISHATSSSINAGKVIFTKNPMAINYSEWLAFSKYCYSQFKWAFLQKPLLQEQYVNNKIQNELESVYKEIDNTFNDTLDKYMIIFE